MEYLREQKNKDLMIRGSYFPPNVNMADGNAIYFVNVADRRVSFNIEGINRILKDKFKDEGFSLTEFEQDMREIKRIFEAMEEVDKENIKKRLHEISKKWGIIDIKVEI